MEKSEIIVAIDCSGGDGAPRKVIAGISRVCHKLKGVSFILYGNENQISPLLDGKYAKLKPYIKELHHTDVVVEDGDKPSFALRNRKESSLFLAVDAVKEGKADAVISAGNTGAYMAKSVITLRMLDGISRPAIITRIPTKKNPISVLDLGANSSCSSDNLVQFALMGDAYTRILSENIPNPSIRILNIGGEELKGTDTVQMAHVALKEIEGINYQGFLEANHLYDGDTQVIVTDGFTGNVLLKAIEGTASFLGKSLYKAIKGNLLGILGGLFLVWPLLKLKKRLDPRIYNGAMFIGLNGVCVKSHGSADDYSFSFAVRMAYFLVKENINEKIKAEIKQAIK